MELYYGLCRVSTGKQNLDRQITNIKTYYPTAEIYKEKFTGTTTDRPIWKKLKEKVLEDISHGHKVYIVFDSVSRMSRNAEEGYEDYQFLYNSGVELVFIKEPHINTSVFRQSVSNAVQVDLQTGNKAVDEYFKGNIQLVNTLILHLAEQQIQCAFNQAQKEVDDLHQRISEGLRESVKKKGTVLGIKKGTKLTTKKSIQCKEIIKKYSRSYGGTLSDNQVQKLCGCARNTYYKYKRELDTE